MRPRIAHHLALATIVVAAACVEQQPNGEAVCGREDQRTLYFHQRPAVDVLVVLDRSPSMAETRDPLTTAGPVLANLLAQIAGGLPDLHLAVITSNLGAQGVPGCGGDGDGAALQGGGRCGLEDPYLAARGLVEGGVRRNFTGELGATIGCLLDAPIATCPVSQPLAAAVRALDGTVPSAAGFRRPDAGLAIVIVTDGDDCSLATPDALAGITGTTPADIEAAVDMACFARGTQCTPADPLTPGRHDGCTPRGDAGIADARALVVTLADAGRGGTRIVEIRGGTEVDVIDGRLAPACSGDSTAGPAPRLDAASLPERTLSTSICSSDWTDAMLALTEYSRTLEGPFCFDTTLDVRPDVVGAQVSCAMRLTDADGVTVGPLPWCDAPGVTLAQACAQPVEPDPEACPDGLGSLRLNAGDQLLPADTRVELRCEIACAATFSE